MCFLQGKMPPPPFGVLTIPMCAEHFFQLEGRGWGWGTDQKTVLTAKVIMSMLSQSRNIVG